MDGMEVDEQGGWSAGEGGANHRYFCFFYDKTLHVTKIISW